MSTQCAIEKLGSNEILKELSDGKNHPYCFEENGNNIPVMAFEGDNTICEGMFVLKILYFIKQ